MRMARLLAEMRGPEISPMYDVHESIPHVTLLKGLGTSNISLVRNAMMDIANAQPRFSIAIDRIDVEGGYGSKRNCEHHWVTVQVLGNAPWLRARIKQRSRFTVSDITPLTKLMIKKPAEMPRHIADNYRQQFLLHHQDQMYPVTAVGLCLMKMQNVTLHRGNRIRISDLDQSDITYEEIPFRGITSESDDRIPVSDQWKEAEL
ncbi:hypothetical protein EAF04_000589 [Stromatinia cepivora]|nr:hypothetical protein EAF04_000589 [Stromatinia cepivora]